MSSDPQRDLEDAIAQEHIHRNEERTRHRAGVEEYETMGELEEQVRQKKEEQDFLDAVRKNPE